MDAPPHIEQRSGWFETAPLALGVGGELVVLHISKIIESVAAWHDFGAAAVVLMPLGFLSARLARAPAWIVAGFFLAGMGGGVVVDVITDTKDRNLFPFEIAWWWALGAVPLAIGIAAARVSRRESFQ